MRWRAGWAVVVALVGIAAPSPAAAHTCGEEPTIKAGVDTEIEVGVLSGDLPAGAFSVVFDESFEVVEGERSGPWRPEASDNTLRYSGGTLDPGTCVLFRATVRASTEGAFRVRVLQQVADGTIVEYPQEGDLFGQPDGSFVQVDRNGPPNAVFEQVINVTPGSDDSTPTVVFVALAAAVALALAWLWRSRSVTR